jgi:hypothetical protein
MRRDLAAMRGRRIRNPLERTLLAAAALVGFAAMRWILAFTVSWASGVRSRGAES